MKKIKRIILIVIIIALCICIVIPLLISGLYALSEFNNELDRKKIINETKEITTTYLEEKYPERQFEIKSVDVDECYNGFVFAGWDHRTHVTICDKTGEYKVYVYTLESKTSGELVCFDTVETEIIKNAMIQKIQKITGLQSDIIEYNFDFDYPVDEWFHQKFDGNITSFLEKENEYKTKYENDELDIDLYCAYLNGTENFHIDEDDKKFLQIFDVITLINFADEIPKPTNDGHLFYTFEHTDSVKSSILDRGISLNSLYVYNKEKNEFENMMDN